MGLNWEGAATELEGTKLALRNRYPLGGVSSGLGARLSASDIKGPLVEVLLDGISDLMANLFVNVVG